MIDLLPTLSETIVLSLRADEVVQKLRRGIEEGLFFGEVDNIHFRITAKIIRPTQFQPILKGVIESSSRGSIIMLKYSMLAATRIFLFCWTAIIVLTTAVATWKMGQVWYLGIGAFVLIVIWWIAKTNLRLQSVPARQALLNQLS